MTVKATDKFKYVFKVKSNSDLSVLIRLIEVLELKQGEYYFNNINSTIEVIRSANWEEILNNKIRELGFEDILKAKAYNITPKYSSISGPYKDLQSVNELFGQAKQAHKSSVVEFLTTQIEHIAGTVSITYKIMPSKDINMTNYAVALAIYNRSYFPVDDNNQSVINIDTLIASIPDEELKNSLKTIKDIFF